MKVVGYVEKHLMTFKGLRCLFQLKIISLVELTIFEMPKNNQTGKPFPMKGNPSGVRVLKVGGIRKKEKSGAYIL